MSSNDVIHVNQYDDKQTSTITEILKNRYKMNNGADYEDAVNAIFYKYKKENPTGDAITNAKSGKYKNTWQGKFLKNGADLNASMFDTALKNAKTSGKLADWNFPGVDDPAKSTSNSSTTETKTDASIFNQGSNENATFDDWTKTDKKDGYLIAKKYNKDEFDSTDAQKMEYQTEVANFADKNGQTLGKDNKYMDLNNDGKLSKEEVEAYYATIDAQDGTTSGLADKVNLFDGKITKQGYETFNKLSDNDKKAQMQKAYEMFTSKDEKTSKTDSQKPNQNSNFGYGDAMSMFKANNKANFWGGLLATLPAMLMDVFAICKFW